MEKMDKQGLVANIPEKKATTPKYTQTVLELKTDCAVQTIQKHRPSTRSMFSQTDVEQVETVYSSTIQMQIDQDEQDFLVKNKPKSSKSFIEISKKSHEDSVVYQRFEKSEIAPDGNAESAKLAESLRNKNFQYTSTNDALNEYFTENLSTFVTGNSKTGTKKSIFKGILASFVFI